MNNKMKKNMFKTFDKNDEILNKKEQFKITDISNLSDFPKIIVSNNKMNKSVNKKKQDTSFVDIVKKNNPMTVDNSLQYVKPGWVSISKDVKTNKIIYHEGASLSDRNKDENNCESLLNSLVVLYNNRKSQYIKMWGKDEYEKMFQIPNYDYEYFDKLDNEYNLREAENNSPEYNSEDEETYDSFDLV
jgi:hypothetical protein